MIDIFLLVIGILGIALTMVLSFYFVVYFQDPADKFSDWGPKIIVTLGMALAICNLLIIPYSVAFGKTAFPIGQISLYMLLSSSAISLVIIPFFLLYYETYDYDFERNASTSKAKRLFNAALYTFLILCLLAAVIVPLYIFCGEYERRALDEVDNALTGGKQPKRVNASFPEYALGVVSGIGWTVLAIFASIGLVDLFFNAFDSINKRAVKITKNEYIERKKEIGERCKQLLKAYRDAQKSSRVAKAFKKDVLALERENELLKTQYSRESTGMLLFARGIFGLLSMAVYGLWMTQLIVYTIPQMMGFGAITHFLNVALKWASRFPLLGTTLYGILAFWLLFAVVEGALAASGSIFLFNIYPIRVGETLTNALLFNAGLILCASVAIVHLCVLSFNEYCRKTAICSLFAAKIQNMLYLRWLYTSCAICVAGLSALRLVYRIFFFQCRRRRTKTHKELKK